MKLIQIYLSLPILQTQQVEKISIKKYKNCYSNIEGVAEARGHEQTNDSL